MAAAAAAAAKFTGRYASHPLLPATAQLVSDACKGRITPSWTPHAQKLFGMFEKVGPCLPRYEQFLKKTNRKDLKRAHVFMNEEAQAKLGEFYLCCALRLRPEAVDVAGQDAEKLLKLANEVANEEVEPFFQECRDFVKDYDPNLHTRLSETTIWHEVDDGLFWHHSFEATTPKAYKAYRSAVLPPEEAWPAHDDSAAVEALLETCSREVAEGGRARALAEEVYRDFLEASATPIKANIRTALIDHGIMAGDVVFRDVEKDLQAEGKRPAADGKGPRAAKL